MLVASLDKMDQLYGPYAKRSARTLAFLGRYMHQSVTVLMAMPACEVADLIEATAALLEREAPDVGMKE